MSEQTVIEAVEEQVAKLAFLKNPKVIGIIGIVSGTVGGFAAGYLVAKKHLEPKYAALAENEIAEAREHYQKIHKKDQYPTVEDAVRDLIPPSEQEARDALQSYSGLHKVAKTVEIVEDEHGIHAKYEKVGIGEKPDLDVVHRNIFVDGEPINDDDWDYDAELEQRTEDRPYIIHEDEFNENEPDFEDVALTYYAGDDILANDKDEIVEDADALIGDRNLRKFGHGSSDKNMLYVRNNTRGLNIEIARSPRSYSIDVLSFEEDDEPPQPVKPRRKNRGEDDE